jgi:GT2 family glycosyltransferase
VPEPLVTIVVSPRERFSYARTSLESILEHTEAPYRLVYVDGGSPRGVRRYLEERARERGFELIRTEHHLSPNRARNLGLARVKTPYVAFIDNDVVVSPGWLDALVRCAEETGATVVSPLVCQGEPLHTEIHCAGGVSAIEEGEADGKTTRRIIERIFKQGLPMAEERPGLERGPTGLAEFHCMMVRTDFFEGHGPLDEGLLNSKEHVDLCIQVLRAGGAVYLEPESVVTYVTVPPMAPSDVPYYMLRWSDAWESASLDRLVEKYELVDDPYIAGRRRNIGWRRRMALLKPLSRRLARSDSGRLARKIENRLVRLDRRLNRWMTDRHARRATRAEPARTPDAAPLMTSGAGDPR